jgi:beta-glucosidase
MKCYPNGPILKNYCNTFFFFAFLIVSLCSVTAQKPSEKDIEGKVEFLLTKMTFEEKVGQMLNIGLPAILTGDYWKARDTVIIDPERIARYIGKYGAGCIHNTPGFTPGNKEWNLIISAIQEYALKNTRLGIPVIYGIDDIHGANYVLGSTLMPQQIALAATWNPKYAFETGKITSYESRSASLPWNYNPNADIAASPLWGRISESFGEDPYLVAEMVSAYVKGSQDGSLQDSVNTAVCLKHFLGYGNGANGKDRANALIPENYLRQYYIPPFQKAIENGAMSIMISSNAINGVPCLVNKYYITDILKGELGFKGVTVSDFSDVEFLIDAHQVAADKREATKQAINAGLDMIMNPYDADVVDFIVDLVKSNEISSERIDDAVRRILRIKFMLNLFEVPYTDPNGYIKFASSESAQKNYEAVCEAITLLKNDGILPLQKNKKVLVTGYTSNSQNSLNGAWSRTFMGRDTKYNDPGKLTVLDAVKKQAGEKNVIFAEGTDYLTDINTKDAVLKARDVDYIIVCMGEIPATEKPSDIMELDMPIVQQELVKKLAATGKPVIIVMLQGRTRIIREIEPLVNGILMAYLPGDEGGRAIADILYGDINPSGKLPYTYQKYGGNMLTYLHKKTDIRDVNWGYNGFTPQYQFGFGLSYTSFEYSNINFNTDTLSGDKQLVVSIDVKNTGKIAGKEIVELYSSDLIASIAPDVIRLIGFTKINLEPGETKKVTFTIDKKDLAFVDINNKWVNEDGTFKISIGGDPKNLISKNFYYQNK